MRNISKRIASVLLCVAMVLTMAALPVSAAGENLLVNSGFENGKTGWSFGSGTGTNNNNPWSKDSGYHFYTNSGSEIRQDVLITESGEYVLTGVIGGWGELALERGGKRIVSQSRANSAYIEMTMDGIQLSAGDKVTVVLDGGTNWLNGDDIFFGTVESWDEIQAAKVEKLIDGDLSDETSVRAARRAYDALSAQAQAMVSNYMLLVQAEETVNEQAAGQVQDMIAALDRITEDSLADVVEARKAYNRLTQLQKEKVLNLPRLEEAEAILKELGVYFERRMTPIMGWSSWNCYLQNISETKLKTQIDALVSTGLADAGYTYFNIDDAWQAGRNSETGLVNVSKTKFPNGLKVIADYAHEKGLKAGIYSDAGTFTCASMYSGEGDNGRGVGLYGYDYVDLYEYFINWDFDFIKVDFCGGKHDPNGPMSQQERYTAIGNVIEELELIKGEDIIFNVCCWEFPGEWVVDVGDSWRVGSDITPNFSSVMYEIEQARPLGEYHGPGHVNDLDMMHVGNGMTYEEDKSHFSMWCMMSAPLILGNDLTKMTQETLEIVTNEELIAINQDPAVIMASVAREADGIQVWEKPLGSQDSNEKAVAILNTNNYSVTTTLSWSEVGFDGEVQVRDLWEHKDLTVGDSITVSLPAHGITVLKVTGDSLEISDSIIKGYSRSIPEQYDLAAEGELDWMDLTNGTEKEDSYIIEVVDEDTIKVKAVSSERVVKVYLDSFIDGGLDAGFGSYARMDGKECRLFGSEDSVCSYTYTGEPGGSEMTISVNGGKILGVAVSEGEEPIDARDQMLLSNSTEAWNLNLSEGTLGRNHYNIQNNGSSLMPAYVNSNQPEAFAVAPGVTCTGANQFLEIYLPARETLTRAKIYYGIANAKGYVQVKNGDQVQTFDIYDISGGEEDVLTIWYTASDDVTVTIVLESMLAQRGMILLEAATLAEETSDAVMGRPEITEKDGVFHITADTMGQGSGEYTVSVLGADGKTLDTASGTVSCGDVMDAAVNVPENQEGCRLSVEFGGVSYDFDLPLTGENDPEDLDFIGNLRAKQLVEDGAILLDVRSLEEYETEHISGAEHMLYTDILTDAEDAFPDKSQPIVVYCSAGKRSTQAQMVLTGLGYENVYNMGAMSNWYIEPTITIGESGGANEPGMEVSLTYSANPYEDGLRVFYACGADSGFDDAIPAVDFKAIVEGDGWVKAYLVFDGEVVAQAEKKFKLLYNAPIPDVDIDVYMSDLNWTKNESSVAAARKDRSYDGNSLNIAGISFPKGIGAHAPSVVEVKIPEGMTRFIAVGGADNEVGPGNAEASKEIRKTKYSVYIDDVLMDESLELPVGYYHLFDIRIPEGAQVIRLEVDPTADKQYHDHADWGIAGFVAWEYPEVEEILLSQTSAELTVGESMKLEAAILPENAPETELVWTSSDESVASVNNGTVTAVAEGEAVITVTAENGVSAECVITVVEPFVNPFTDVKEGDWYYDSVMWAVQNGITSGATETTFNYDGLSERCQVVTFLWRAAGEPEPETTVNPFTDVNEGHYFYKAVLWAYEKGITQGISDTEFGPFAKCTRGQVVTFLHRVEGTPESSFVNSFEDVNETHYFYDAVLWAAENEITVGVTETSFAPENKCKRSEIVTFLYRCMAE